MSADPAATFEDCLREEELTDVSVKHYTKDVTDVFRVSKNTELGDLVQQVEVDFHYSDDRSKRIATEAKLIAEAFRECMSTEYDWRDTSVTLSLYDGGWAECNRCGTKVTVPENRSVALTTSSDTSCPDPLTTSADRLVGRFSADERILLKLYLLGLIESECTCDESIERFKYE